MHDLLFFAVSVYRASTLWSAYSGCWGYSTEEGKQFLLLCGYSINRYSHAKTFKQIKLILGSTVAGRGTPSRA